MLANQLDSVCKILSVSEEDTKAVEVLTILFEHIGNAVMLRIGETQIPKMLEWLVNEVVVKRYQQIGTEHLLSEAIDVLSSTFKRGDMLEEYEPYLTYYIENIQAKSEDGKQIALRKLRML